MQERCSCICFVKGDQLSWRSLCYIFATLVAVAIFETVFPDRKVEWNLLVKKATQFLKDNENSGYSTLVCFELVSHQVDHNGKREGNDAES